MAELFNYPLTIGEKVAQGQHYMLIDSYESKNAVHSKDLLLSSIALYIPQDALQTTMTQTYGAVAGGALMAHTGSTMVTGEGESMIANMATAYLRTEGEGGERALAGLGSLLSRAKPVEAFMGAAAGQARNKHMAMVYQGPGEMRTHQFVFNFFPKDKDEALEVKKIINDFKNGSTPKMAGGAVMGSANPLSEAFFSSPRHYRIKFMMGSTGGRAGTERNKYLFQIGTSVIKSLAINHDPSSAVGFHTDGSPVASRLTISFQELEYLISSDVKNKALSDTTGDTFDEGIINRWKAANKGLDF